MMNDTDPQDLELAAMMAFLEKENIVIQDKGCYPLITYSSLYDAEAMKILAENGDHLRAAVLAARQGIPVAKWPLMLINLAKPDNLQVLNNGQWQTEWSGVWIHKSHGMPGFCLIDTPQSGGQFTETKEFGLTFYNKYARHIVHSSSFQYAVFNVCDAACRAIIDNKTISSFIEQLHERCGKRIYGAHAKTWTPLYGVHRGKILISQDPFLASCDGVERRREDYYTGSLIMLSIIGERFLSKEKELQLSALLTDKYFHEAEFNPDTADPLHWRTDDALGNTKWYYKA